MTLPNRFTFKISKHTKCLICVSFLKQAIHNAIKFILQFVKTVTWANFWYVRVNELCCILIGQRIDCDVGAANVESTSPIQEVNCPVTFMQRRRKSVL